MFEKQLKAIEGAEPLDELVEPIANLASCATASTPVKNALAGTWLGHRLHPLLTDIPIGTWTSAALLDLTGGEGSEAAADRLIALGVLATLPTAAAGLSDWSDAAEQEQKRVGLLHAAANVAGLGLQLLSLVARRRGHRGTGKALSMLAMGAVGAGGFLGGHLSYDMGVGVDYPTGSFSREWRRVAAFDELPDGALHRVDVDGVPAVLVRTGVTVRALAETCIHAGGPLSEGELVDGCLRCPWHASTFRLDDGSVVRGPATSPQPVLDARVVNGSVEIRSQVA